ncbi:alpha-ribazole phosphatase [Chitinophagaceae bacterium LWZ2-11]
MEIYLIRHTTPLVDKGICYGQTDLDITDSFLDEASVIKDYLPAAVNQVFSSPLQRCKKLAHNLYPDNYVETHNALKELNCGDWEMKHWDAIPQHQIQPWMSDFVHTPIPGGESYTHLYRRVISCFRLLKEKTQGTSAIITHGGVIRSILAYITDTPLSDSFNAFNLHYGCVIKIIPVGNDAFRHEVKLNIPPVKPEQHKPSGL